MPPPFDGPDGYRAGLEDLARIVSPRARPWVSEWAAEFRVLDSKQSAYPGPWKNERVPYLAGFMDALDFRHPAPVVVVAKSAQSCFSDALLNWIGRGIHRDATSFLVLWPTVEIGKSWMRTRVNPMIAGIPGLRLQMTSGRQQTDSTLQEVHWPGGVMFIGSANKSDDVSRVSVPNLVLDDADRMPRVLEGEGDPFELALLRQITYPRRKAVIVSTPTNEENSRVWPAFESSTRDRFHVPCVHCNHMQHLRFAQLKWIPGKPEGARYMCEECAALMENRNKREMLANGEWRAEFPERESEVKGFHINGLYAPVGLGDEWARHAAAWERAQGSDARIQVFYNTRLGMVHKGEREKIEWKEIRARAEPYALRSVPRGTLVLTSFTDIQKDRVETQVLGWGRREQATVIDYIVHEGDPTRHEPTEDGKPSVWSTLETYLTTPIDNAFGVPMRIACAMIDSGYLPDDVKKFTRARRALGIFATRGSTNASRQAIGRPTFPDTRGRKGKIDQRGVEVYELGVSVLKHWLFDKLKADAGKPDAPVLPADRHLRFSTELRDEYFRQLMAEIYDPKEGWIARANYHRNEALDTFLGCRAAAMHQSVGVHRMREADWIRLEQLYEPVATPKATPAPELGRVPIERPGGRFLPISAIVRNPEQ